jgi:type IX secretion system PorP/SprF family membrane protein
MMKAGMKHIVLAFVACIAAIWSIAQDLHFSQFYNAPLSQNPALAGAINSRELYINYRNQWRAVSTPFKTFAASAATRISDAKSRKGFWAMGGRFYNDQAGDGNLKTISGAANLVYHIRLSKYQHLGLGMSGGFGQRSINWDSFQWGSQYSNGSYLSGLPNGEFLANNSVRYADIQTGIVWSFNNTSDLIKVTSNNFNQGNVGISMHHVNRPSFGFMDTGERQQIKYVAHGDFLFSLKNTPLAIQPGFMAYMQGPASEIVFGSQVRYELLANSKYTGIYKGGGISIGAFYRMKDAMIFTGMIEFAQYSFGFSYDMNTSNLVSSSGGRGAMEFCFRIINQNPYFKDTKIF